MLTAKQSATEIVRTLRQHGYQAYLVGGCVRDLLLGREPADYDVATDATPNEVMRIFPRTWAVGAQFGVVLVPVDGGGEEEKKQVRRYVQDDKVSGVVEVATFRSDGLYTDGRHPDQVTFTRDPKEDVQRRDFTINGLLLDPLNNEVLDYVGGRADLSAGIIRTIGQPERRFAEDKLRMLRAVRFAARFGYQIDTATFEAIRNLRSQIHQVSRERVRDELVKMLTEGRARRAFELLDQTGLLKEVLPEVDKMHGVDQPPQFHPEGDVWVHTLLLLESLPEKASLTLAMGGLLHDVGKPPTFRVAPDRIRFDSHVEVGVKMAEQICHRLRFSKHDTEQIARLVANHMRFADTKEMKPSTLKRFFRLPRFEEHLELHRLDCLASHRDLSLYSFVREKLAQMPAEQIRPKPLLTGDDLISMGYTPGPRFKQILAAVEDAQLEGRLQDTDAARAFVRREFPV
ncbi:MAG TPA: CCA tRNA nucleotidyltransferase [Terriglobales bacterium]|nr:CCA tRNA nucleotidyltransferase [Terriglobales bacterium]